MKEEYHLKPSFIKVDNIYAEDLFKWAWDTMFSSGGDGGSAIICENPTEVKEFFLEWYEKEYGHKNKFDIVESHGGISFISGQDTMTITNDVDYKLAFHEYTFMVESECVFGCTEELKDRVIRPVQ